jgi:glyoxylase-like metal-dependent hydrolase (beta-lactamase superfamily II)
LFYLVNQIKLRYKNRTGKDVDIAIYKNKLHRNTLNEEQMICEGMAVQIEEHHEFAVEGATLRTIFTPGHTPDHISFAIKEEGSIISGDILLGQTILQYLKICMISASLCKSFKTFKNQFHHPILFLYILDMVLLFVME